MKNNGIKFRFIKYINFLKITFVITAESSYDERVSLTFIYCLLSFFTVALICGCPKAECCMGCVNKHTATCALIRIALLLWS